MKKRTVKVVFLGLLIFCFFIGVEEVFSLCVSSFFKQPPRGYYYKIEYSKPVFLDVENLRRNRTIYVALIGFNVEKDLEEKVRGYLFEELKKVGMNIVSEQRMGAYLIGVFLKKFAEDEVVVDVLIRERPEIKGFEGRAKVYASDLDSIDHLTTLKIKKVEKKGEIEKKDEIKRGEEDDIFKKLTEVLAGLFKIF
jgi:hypothetical protein